MWLYAACLCAMLTLGVICQGQEAATDSQASANAIVQDASKGELNVTLTINHDTITVVDTITLTLDAKVPETMKVSMPNVIEALDEFSWGIVKIDTPRKKLLDDGRVLFQKIVELEPIQSEILEIPSLTITATVDDVEIETTTKAVTIKVTDFMEIAEDAQVVGRNDGQAVMPFIFPSWGYWAMGVAVLVIIIIVLIVILVTRKPKVIKRLYACPHEIAVNRFKRLDNEMLLQDQQFKRFYELTCLILRYYIEDRFKLNAPDLTTEEFLGEASKTGKLSGDQTEQLKGFMNQCDMVKFAMYAPSIEDAKNALALAEGFVEKTTNYDMQVEVTGKAMYEMFTDQEVAS